MSKESALEPLTTADEDCGNQGFFDSEAHPDPPPASPDPPQAANRPNTPWRDPPGTCGVSERRWVKLKKGERMIDTMIYHTYIAPSKVKGAGLGCFAGEVIPAGSHIGEYGGLKLQGGRTEAAEL